MFNNIVNTMTSIFNTVNCTNNNTNINENYQIINKFRYYNAIIYIRVSTKEQHIEAQKYSCEQFCILNNLNVKNIYIEKTSAYKGNKQIILEDILNNNKNVNLIINSADRFSRNIENCNQYINLLEKNNIDLYSVKENINLTTAFGKHQFRTLINTAQFESELISERVKNSINYRKANNILIGSVPYGYMKKNGILIRDDKEQAVIKFIFNNYRKFKSSAELSNNLYKLLDIFEKDQSYYVPILFTEEDDNYEYQQYNNTHKIKITYKILLNILNDYDLLKRNKQWSVSSINLKNFELKSDIFNKFHL